MASQSTHSYLILPEQAQEDALHATRLLAVEERPFSRVSSNLLGKTSLLKWTPPQQLPSPPPDGADPDTPPTAVDLTEEARKRAIFREDVLLDFAALESSILRIQLIQSSNQRERERYAAEKAKILDTAQAVRDNTASLRVQLAEAQRVLELRKGYDELAAKLIDPKKLKPRAETREDIEKIEKEIEDLELESREFESTWLGRREAFERVVEEGEAMMRVVKGIKDEPDKVEDEHMDDGDGEDEGEGEGRGEEGVKGGDGSRIGTPAPGRTPMRRELTPQPEGEEEMGRVSSQVATPMPAREGEDEEIPATDDVEMMEEGEEAPLEPQPKTTTGMEVSSDQVATPAEGMEGTEDQEPEAAVGTEGFDQDQEETNALAVEPAEVLDDQPEEEQQIVTPPHLAEEMDES